MSGSTSHFVMASDRQTLGTFEMFFRLRWIVGMIIWVSWLCGVGGRICVWLVVVIGLIRINTQEFITLLLDSFLGAFGHLFIVRIVFVDNRILITKLFAEILLFHFIMASHT